MSDKAGVIQAPWNSQFHTAPGRLEVTGGGGTSTILQHSKIQKPLPNVPGECIELGRILDIERSRPGKIDADDLRNCARARGHDDDAIRKEDGFVDAVGHERYSFPFFQPDALQIEVHLV